MRTIVHAIYASLDGVVDDPAWTTPFFNDELAALQRQQLFASDALLLGRVTYEAFAASWPAMTDGGGFAERMNSLPKYVASRTLAGATWGATVLRGNVEEEVARLKKADGGDLLIYGSPTLADVLTHAGLIDEYPRDGVPGRRGARGSAVRQGDSRAAPSEQRCDDDHRRGDAHLPDTNEGKVA